MSWIHRNLFGSTLNSVLTLFCIWFLWQTVPPLVDWVLLEAVWVGSDPAACRSAEGACWAFIYERHRFILFGLYPFEEHWRPILATLLFIVMLGCSCEPRFWRPWLVIVWAVVLAMCALLMWGGVFGLTFVENARWGGLPLTLILAVVGMIFSFPFAILLALGRRSRLPAIRSICVGYIELIRGVPLVSVLFMASVMFPLFLPEGLTIDKLLRAQVGMILFAAAYLAEAIRGGL
ncbi:MAG: ABC transporter permease subunit, partial [Pseudomonadota bacterium]